MTERTKIVFIANPNNPTVSFLTTDEMRRLHAGLPEHVVLVIDAAYAEYVDRPDYTAGAELVEEFGNVVMTRTQINGSFYTPRGIRMAAERAAERLAS